MTEKEFKKHKAKFKGDFAAYKFAISLEAKSYDFYKKQAEAAKEKKAKEFFRFLMKEEATHKKILEESMDFLKNPEDYFLKKEGWHFD
jgi:rubrerythrin